MRYQFQILAKLHTEGTTPLLQIIYVGKSSFIQLVTKSFWSPLHSHEKIWQNHMTGLKNWRFDTEVSKSVGSRTQSLTGLDLWHTCFTRERTKEGYKCFHSLA